MPILSRSCTMHPHRIAVVFVATTLAILNGPGCNKSSPPPVSAPSNPEQLPGPSFDDAELMAARQASVNNLYQLGLAMHQYEFNHKVLPTPGYALDRTKPQPAFPWDPVSWRVKLLPYMKQQELAQRIQPFVPIPDDIASTVVPLYL